MENRSVFGLSISRTQADLILSQLKIAGFFSSEISVLFRHQSATSPRKRDATDLTLIRGTVGWLAGTVQFAFPDGGPLIAAGPILGALIAASSVVGSGLTAGIMALGVPKLMAARYDVAIRAGNILVSTQTATPTEIDVAWKVLRYAQAQDICLTDERGMTLGVNECGGHLSLVGRVVPNPPSRRPKATSHATALGGPSAPPSDIFHG